MVVQGLANRGHGRRNSGFSALHATQSQGEWTAARKAWCCAIDAFGNVMTNFRAEDLPESAKNGGGLNLKVGTHTISRLVDTFANGAADEPIAYVGSSGYLEIGINKANACAKIGNCSRRGCDSFQKLVRANSSDLTRNQSRRKILPAGNTSARALQRSHLRTGARIEPVPPGVAQQIKSQDGGHHR